jgi:hypothetical protein
MPEEELKANISPVTGKCSPHEVHKFCWINVLQKHEPI